MTQLDGLLQRSSAFTEHLFSLMAQVGPLREDPRSTAAASACALSLEHAQALHVLLEAGAPNTAAAVLRMQYEALLRGSWLLYAASDLEVARATAELDLRGQSRAQGLIGAKGMLEGLAALLESQPHLVGLVAPLQEIREQSWKAMSQYVHAGLHPLHRSAEGFPHALTDQLVRNANGMMLMAALLYARLSLGFGIPPTVLEHAYKGHEDCLPMKDTV